jgi:uncharacterized phosphosugar-binding protein
MGSLRTRYRTTIVDILDRLLDQNSTELDQARDTIAAALAADRMIYVAGSGHSHLIAEEVFYRAGGIAAAQAILDPDLMLHLGAERSTLLERESGRAEQVLARYPVAPGDVVIVVSNSGRNAYPIELALAAKAKGATTIALTSLAHARETTPRHMSGKRLFEVTDIVIDNGGVYGDASLPIPGRDIAMGPTSTIIGVFLINALLADAVADLAARGQTVDVYRSANMQGAEGEAEAMIAKWRPRVPGL